MNFVVDAIDEAIVLVRGGSLRERLVVELQNARASVVELINADLECDEAEAAYDSRWQDTDLESSGSWSLEELEAAEKRITDARIRRARALTRISRNT